MIFDRSQIDIDSALVARQKLQKGENLTEADVIALERGTLSLSTLNRIESKTDELRNILSQMAYFAVFDSAEWNAGDVFFGEDFKKILANTETLRNAFYVYRETPQTPDALTDYKTMNALEKILADLEKMIADVTANYRQCGNSVCGE
jgi:hypothetical protein